MGIILCGKINQNRVHFSRDSLGPDDFFARPVDTPGGSDLDNQTALGDSSYRELRLNPCVLFPRTWWTRKLGDGSVQGYVRCWCSRHVQGKAHGLDYYEGFIRSKT